MFNRLLGDLGRHGQGPIYNQLAKKYRRAAYKSTQVKHPLKYINKI